MGFINRVRAWWNREKKSTDTVKRGFFPLDFPSWLQWPVQSSMPDRDKLFDGSWDSAVHHVLTRNAVMFGAHVHRARIFAQAPFILKERTRRLRGAVEGWRPAEKFWDESLALLEHPSQSMDAKQLRMKMIQSNDVAGTAFIARPGRGDRLVWLRPDWVTVVWGSNRAEITTKWNIDAEIIGYVYSPNGVLGGDEEVILLPEEVATWYEVADPNLPGLGMPWWLPVLDEIQTDNSAQNYIKGYFENGAQPGTVISLDPSVPFDDAKRFAEKFKADHQGALQAYKTVVLGGGAQLVSQISSNLKDLDTVTLNAAQETRIAMCSGVPAVLLGLEVSMRHGSFSLAEAEKDRFINTVLWDLWDGASAALGTILDIPGDAELTVDTREVPYLNEDRKLQAEIQQIQAATLGSLIQQGWTPPTAQDALMADNYRLLEHTGRFSVQLLPLEAMDESNATKTNSGGANKPASSQGGSND